MDAKFNVGDTVIVTSNRLKPVTKGMTGQVTKVLADFHNGDGIYLVETELIGLIWITGTEIEKFDQLSLF